ncbi:DUF3237 domain-containing protein [Herbiconiux sp. YIM B11900]|uniref:DUF3237 domain-containing protein n=1 Tax=Herbiconiux sp. YIM B11900 TaxID=3404131 RepID=UPI003F840159
MTLPLPTLEHVFDVEVRLGEIEDHGMTRVGHRRIVPIVGGSIRGRVGGTLGGVPSGALDDVPDDLHGGSGDELVAQILPGGADWQVVRADGSIEIDGRYSASTSEGELLYLHAAGIRSGAPEVLEALLRGEPVDPGDYYFRTTVSIETSSPRLAALQRALYVAVAERAASTVRYATYRLT